MNQFTMGLLGGVVDNLAEDESTGLLGDFARDLSPGLQHYNDTAHMNRDQYNQYMVNKPEREFAQTQRAWAVKDRAAEEQHAAALTKQLQDYIADLPPDEKERLKNMPQSMLIKVMEAKAKEMYTNKKPEYVSSGVSGVTRRKGTNDYYFGNDQISADDVARKRAEQKASGASRSTSKTYVQGAGMTADKLARASLDLVNAGHFDTIEDARAYIIEQGSGGDTAPKSSGYQRRLVRENLLKTDTKGKNGMDRANRSYERSNKIIDATTTVIESIESGKYNTGEFAGMTLIQKLQSYSSPEANAAIQGLSVIKNEGVVEFIDVTGAKSGDSNTEREGIISAEANEKVDEKHMLKLLYTMRDKALNNQKNYNQLRRYSTEMAGINWLGNPHNYVDPIDNSVSTTGGVHEDKRKSLLNKYRKGNK